MRYDNFDSNEVLHAKLVAGKTGYDIVVPSSYWAKLQADGGVLRKLDRVTSSGSINDMANGSMCLALAWSGDISIARQRAIDGKTGQKIESLTPKTGGILFFDMMVIPADAPNPDSAHKFSNYILKPEVAAGLTNKVFYANPNLESKKFVKPEVAKNPAVFLNLADLQKVQARTRSAATSGAR